jgi:16S rRNA processing protein RimM
VRPHGIGGRVVVELSTNRTERLDPGSVLASGDRELVVESAAPLHDHLRQERWVVGFEGVGDRHQAEALRGAVLQAQPLHVEGALWVHELIGSEVADADGSVIGLVESVEANPASDLLVLQDGRLIPLRFVVAAEPGKLTVSLPAGLLEL